MVPFLHSELLEDIDLDAFLKEDQATLRKRGWETVSRVVRELCDYLQHECGEGEALPDNVFWDIMLQVHVHTIFFCAFKFFFFFFLKKLEIHFT